MSGSRLRGAPHPDKLWELGPDEVSIGVDVIELVSSGMYVEPLAAYREYVQNAADAIDDARASGVLAAHVRGRIEIFVEHEARTIRIRDNGAGLAGPDFVRRLTAFGSSDKRGRQRRGFRGVGRLAGIGYCQELLFRSRVSGEPLIRELRWDCRHLRSLLRSTEFRGTLVEAVHLATSHRTVHPLDYPDRFFEVELRGVVRQGKDDLLNSMAVRNYLSQVAPVPFSPTFRYREDIDKFLSDVVPTSDLEIFVDGAGPMYRPHMNTIELKLGLESNDGEVQLFTIPKTDGGIAAKGWVFHHGYLGAIRRDAGVRGLRFRTGNMQIGDDATLESVFSEPRFNAWSIGEFHIVDSRIIPNGRRDQYEHSVHLANVLNHIAPIARGISHRCRTRSQVRQLLRKSELLAGEISTGLAILEQGALAPASRKAHVDRLGLALKALEKRAGANILDVADRMSAGSKVVSFRRRLSRAENRHRAAPRLGRLSPQRRRAYEEVFSLIYDCAADDHSAKTLIDRVLARIDL